MQSLKKNWPVVSLSNWGISWILTQTLKSPKIPLRWAILPREYEVWAKKIQRSYLSWHWTVMQNLNKPWPCGFKNGMRNWVNFHYSAQKYEKVYIDGLFLSKGYNVSARKFQRDYVSWHWRVMQNVKKNWLVAVNMTKEIWLIIRRAGKSLKICTFIGSFCPRHITI